MSTTVTYAGVAGIPTSLIDEELQPITAIERADSHRTHYTWLCNYLERLDGKEARQEYYARLER